MIGDEVLTKCNETELLEIARQQGIRHLKRGLPKEELIAIITGEASVEQRHYSSVAYTRAKLEAYIQANLSKIMSMLPGCNGKCMTFRCSDGRHAKCFSPNEKVVR